MWPGRWKSNDKAPKTNSNHTLIWPHMVTHTQVRLTTAWPDDGARGHERSDEAARYTQPHT